MTQNNELITTFLSELDDIIEKSKIKHIRKVRTIKENPVYHLTDEERKDFSDWMKIFEIRDILNDIAKLDIYCTKKKEMAIEKITEVLKS